MKSTFSFSADRATEWSIDSQAKHAVSMNAIVDLFSVAQAASLRVIIDRIIAIDVFRSFVSLEQAESRHCVRLTTV